MVAVCLGVAYAFQVPRPKVECCRDERFVKARRVNSMNFFAELRRRNVYKVAIAYAVVSWLLMQVASQIFPFFEIPNWAVRLVVLLLGATSGVVDGLRRRSGRRTQ